MANKIPWEARKIIESKIRRYHDNITEYANVEEEILHPQKTVDGQPHGSGLGNPTQQAAIKIADNPRLNRLKQEIDAVEAVYNKLLPEHQKIIRVRFWTHRYKNKTYFSMERSTSYSERQMRRVVFNFVKKVGEKLGEL